MVTLPFQLLYNEPVGTSILLAGRHFFKNDSSCSIAERQSVTVENGHLEPLEPGDDPDFRVATENLKQRRAP